MIYSSCFVSDLTTKQQVGKFAMYVTKCIQHIIPRWFNLHFSRLIPQKTPHVSTILPSSVCILSVEIPLPFQTSKSTIQPERERERENVCVHVRARRSDRVFATPWTVALQASRSMGFSRQEYWSRLPFPPSGDLSDQQPSISKNRNFIHKISLNLTT